MSDEAQFFCGGVIVGATAMIVGLSIALMCGWTRYVPKHSAIEAGVAHYTVDPKTGETSFEFRGCE